VLGWKEMKRTLSGTARREAQNEQDTAKVPEMDALLPDPIVLNIPCPGSGSSQIEKE
jgi:hypothetical protein